MTHPASCSSASGCAKRKAGIVSISDDSEREPSSSADDASVGADEDNSSPAADLAVARSRDRHQHALRSQAAAARQAGRHKAKNLLCACIAATGVLYAVQVGVQHSAQAISEHEPFSLFGKGTVDEHGRQLGGSVSCGDPETLGSKALVLPYLLIVLYAFLGLAVVCDEYFEPALQMISMRLGLSDDVAGATFMAAGSSAPELFTSLSDAFFSQNNIGIGTIVGSAMFNILVIVAMSAAVTKGSVQIDWRPVARDVSFYVSSIVVLVLVIVNDGEVCINRNTLQVYENSSDILAAGGLQPDEECGYGVVEWGEGLAMVGCYGLYILFMVFNKRIMARCAPVQDIKVYDVSHEGQAKARAENDAGSTDEGGCERHGENGDGGGGDNGDDNSDDDGAPWYLPPSGGLRDKLYWALTLPIVALLRCTIPNISEGFFKDWMVLSFTMCIVWIGGFCLLMVDLASKIGCLLRVDPVIMGVVLLAAGTSVPDMMASMIVARNGQADMAIANAVGSNVFDIFLGLGLPWFLVGPILNRPSLVKTQGIAANVAILLGAVFLYVATIVINRWQMNSKIGVVFVFLYVLYIVYSIFPAGTAS